MTSQEQTQLNTLQAAYDAALNNYNIELSDNYKATVGASKGTDYNGQTAAWWQQWKADSDRSLATKKQIMDNAKLALDDYKALLNQSAQNLLITTNPTQYLKNQTEIEIGKAQAAASAKIAADKTNYAAKTTTYIIVAVVVVVIIGTVLYFKYRKKA